MILKHLRTNLVAYLALAIAMGTSTCLLYTSDAADE